jgi:hypothetical protein
LYLSIPKKELEVEVTPLPPRMDNDIHPAYTAATTSSTEGFEIDDEKHFGDVVVTSKPNAPKPESTAVDPKPALTGPATAKYEQLQESDAVRLSRPPRFSYLEQHQMS